MQSRNFFIHLRFILTVFKHKYLRIGDTHEAQYTFRMFCYQERSFDRKDSVKLKNAEIFIETDLSLPSKDVNVDSGQQ